MTSSDAEVARAAAEAGARVVRAPYGGPPERIDKGGNDFATSADLEAEAAILAVLIDPLCGTLNYAVTTRLAPSRLPQPPDCYGSSSIASPNSCQR